MDGIEHVFGRMELIWKPVQADEGFEIVRRRLFLDCDDLEARDAVCRKFSEMYQENSADFPFETKEVDYYAVISLQNGDDIKTVSENLGHATVAFTLDVYGHVTDKMRKDSADRMQAYIESL